MPQSKNLYTDEEAMEMLKERFGDKAEAIAAAFRKAYPDHRVIDALYTDTLMRPGLIEFVRDRAAHAKAPAYEYMFSFETDWDGGLTAWHNAEEPFMFHNARYLESAFVPEASDKLEDAMCSSWLAFGKTGDPNNALIPAWKPVEPDQSNIMIFDRNIRAEADFDEELMKLLPPMDFSQMFGLIGNGKPNPGRDGADLEI